MKQESENLLCYEYEYFSKSFIYQLMHDRVALKEY